MKTYNIKVGDKTIECQTEQYLTVEHKEPSISAEVVTETDEDPNGLDGITVKGIQFQMLDMKTTFENGKYITKGTIKDDRLLDIM